jgi:spermidine synthase
MHAQVVCDFCHAHLEKNKAAFECPRLELINDDARSQLEAYQGKFDVIIGDLADPLDGGPCYQLYTQVGIAGNAIADAGTALVCKLVATGGSLLQLLYTQVGSNTAHMRNLLAAVHTDWHQCCAHA